MPRPLVFNPNLDGLQPVRLWQFDLKDGTTIRLTDADHDITLGDATVWTFEPGVSFSDLAYSDDGRSNSAQVSAPLVAGSLFDPTDIRRGKFRSANVTVKLLDLSDLTTAGYLFGGVVADQTWSEDQYVVTLEIRSDLSMAKVILVETYGSLCRAQFGDYVNPSNPGRCKLPIKPDDIIRNHAYAVGDYVRVQTGSGPSGYANRYFKCTVAGTTAGTQPTYDTTVGHTTADGTATFTAFEAWMRTVTVASIVDAYTFTISDPADSRANVDGYFAHGCFAINGQYGIGYDVRKYTTASKTVAMWLPKTELLTVGTIIDITPGCDRRRVATCYTRFNNAVNFRGED